MTPETLVQRLRACFERSHEDDVQKDICLTSSEAADRIERLEAELARLKESLQPLSPAQILALNRTISEVPISQTWWEYIVRHVEQAHGIKEPFSK